MLAIDAVPVNPTALYRDVESAKASRTGDLDLVACASCGMVRNRAFDPSIVDYDAEYESSQFASPTFRQYAADLADELAERFLPGGGHVVEIGCGEGEFLSLLCDRPGVTGSGFDTTYTGRTGDLPDGVNVERRYLEPDELSEPLQLVVCRHVLEHLSDPATLLAKLAAHVATDTGVYVEVPNAGAVLSPEGVWDLIYDHVSYFRPGSLARLFDRCGLVVDELATTFGGQFVRVIGRRSRSKGRSPDLMGRYEPNLPGDLRSSVLAEWVHRLRRYAERGEAVVVWGAGSRGAMFVAACSNEVPIEAAVDLNPVKQGCFLPGSGVPVVAPGQLRSLEPAAVVVVNPIYRDEISAAVDELGLAAEVLAAPARSDDDR